MKPRSHARFAALLYLTVIGTGAASLFIAPAFYVPGNAAETARRILEGEFLFRLGFLSNFVATLAYIGVVTVLYSLLLPAGRILSHATAGFGLAGCITSAATAIVHLAPLVLLKGSASLAEAEGALVQSQAMMWVRLEGIGSGICLGLFGMYCLLLGTLVVRSRFLPRFVGLLLMLSGVAWLTGSLTGIIAPFLSASVGGVTMPVAILGEAVFTVWLLLFGVNVRAWEARAAKGASS